MSGNVLLPTSSVSLHNLRRFHSEHDACGAPSLGENPEAACRGVGWNPASHRVPCSARGERAHGQPALAVVIVGPGRPWRESKGRLCVFFAALSLLLLTGWKRSRSMLRPGRLCS